MGAGTSPADPTSAEATADPEPAGPRAGSPESKGSGEESGRAGESEGPKGPEKAEGYGEPGEHEESPESPADDEPGATAVTAETAEPAETAAPAETAESRASDDSAGTDDSDDSDGAAGVSRRFPSVTRDTARPEGGGRAAPGDAPAPARQWPLLGVLCAAGAGLLIVAVDPFAEAFRIGAMLIGVALLVGAVLRWVVPSVGMLAVRSRFTDLVTYGLMGTLIVLLALMAQPEPWLHVPFLQDVVHFTIR